MEIIETICKIIGGCSILLIAVSFMWVCARAAVTGDVGAPPATMFIGLFGCFAAGGIWAGASLLIRGTII